MDIDARPARNWRSASLSVCGLGNQHMTIPTLGTVVDGPAGPGSLRLVESLGAGAFGVVYKAESTDTQAYAVKFPSVVGMSDSAELLAFQNEVALAQQIRHPNVVSIHLAVLDAGELPPYLVMDYVAGGTLKSLLDRVRVAGQHVKPELIQTWSNALVDGMAAINSRVLHRDLKPDNILMDSGVPRISDFGLAKVVGAATRSRTFKGGQHVLYMAPEGWKLETNAIQLDMYSLGIVLYETAALKYPYELPANGFDIAALQEMHLFAVPTPLRKVRGDLPVGYSAFIMRLMEKDPGNRFRDWDKTKAALASAWKQETGPGGTATSAILAHLTRQKEEERERELAAEAKRKAIEEHRRLDMYSARKLAESFDAVLAELAQKDITGARIGAQPQVAGRPDRTYNIGKTAVEMHFFEVDPPLKLHEGTASHAALVRSSAGHGFNLLLVRNDEKNLYGKWLAIEVRANPFSQIRFGVEPVGLPADQIREIEVADHAAHVIQIRKQEATVQYFLDFLQQAVEAGK